MAGLPVLPLDLDTPLPDAAAVVGVGKEGSGLGTPAETPAVVAPGAGGKKNKKKGKK